MLSFVVSWSTTNSSVIAVNAHPISVSPTIKSEMARRHRRLFEFKFTRKRDDCAITRFLFDIQKKKNVYFCSFRFHFFLRTYSK